MKQSCRITKIIKQLDSNIDSSNGTQITLFTLVTPSIKKKIWINWWCFDWIHSQLFATKRSSWHCFSGAPCCGFTWPGSSLGDSLESLSTERFFAASAFQMRHSNKTKQKKKNPVLYWPGTHQSHLRPKYGPWFTYTRGIHVHCTRTSGFLKRHAHCTRRSRMGLR